MKEQRTMSGLLTNVVVQSMQSTDLNLRLGVAHSLIDQISENERRTKQAEDRIKAIENSQLCIKAIENSQLCIDVGGNSFPLTIQEYVSLFNHYPICNRKIMAIKMLRTIGSNYGHKITIKDAKEAVENHNNFPQPIYEIVLNQKKNDET